MFGTKPIDQSRSKGFLHKLHKNQPVAFDTADHLDHEIKLGTSKPVK